MSESGEGKKEGKEGEKEDGSTAIMGKTDKEKRARGKGKGEGRKEGDTTD